MSKAAVLYDDPVKVLRGIRPMLKLGCSLVLSTPNTDGWAAQLFGRRWIHRHVLYQLQFLAQRISLLLLLYVHQAGINAAATRLMDALGQGDNGVYFLRSATD
jgi:hypothetical protein